MLNVLGSCFSVSFHSRKGKVQPRKKDGTDNQGAPIHLHMKKEEIKLPSFF